LATDIVTEKLPPLVVAFDIATSTGVCLGGVGEKPLVTTWDMREVGPSRARRLLYFSDLCDEFFSRHKVDVLRYEAPMPIAVASQIGASEQTMLLLRGMVGVLECCAARARIFDINSFAVQDARKHLTGQRTFPRDIKGKSHAKAMVMRTAHVLGVDCKNDNESDAFCGWSYTCALLNPRLAHLVTPLFIGANA
jgi:hypothetical protein